MIPILYEKDETAFISNGLGRLRDVIEAKVIEERNGIYELDFSYPVTAEDFDDIQVGRIVGVTHDDSPDVQPFDIVSFTRPIDGVVSFHCTHISYRQSYMTVTGSNINSLADAFALLGTATPTNPFTYETDKDSADYLSSANGVPKSVRAMLGGTEGSILDAYGGEYEWDKFRVILHSARGYQRDFSIRYGVNMLDYNEEYDSSGTYMSCIPYWTDGTTTVVGDRQDASGSTITGRGECVPLDVSDKFDSSQGTPTKAEVNSMGLSVINSKNPMIPSQNIHVEFVRLQDLGYENFGSLLECKLCDTVKVVFPFYNTTGQFKIVKTVWDVLADRYESMELGNLSTTLAEALGVGNNNGSASSGGGSLVDIFYPVGSYYETSDTTFDPNVSWGGMWSLEAEGLVHIGAGTNYTVGDTGGEDAVTLSVNEMPAHGHIPNNWVVVANANYASGGDKIPTSSSGTFSARYNAISNPDNYVSNNTGGGQAHNNMQPYIVVNRWHRTA